MSAPPYQYLVIHQSCKGGILACQAAHAAGESMRVAPAPSDLHVVALVAEKAEQLEELGRELEKAGIHHVVIREPDPPYNGSAVAVGIEPGVDRSVVQSFVKHFRSFPREVKS